MKRVSSCPTNFSYICLKPELCEKLWSAVIIKAHNSWYKWNYRVEVRVDDGMQFITRIIKQDRDTVKLTPVHIGAFEGTLNREQKPLYYELKQSGGWTPLHLAALAGHYELVNFWLQHEKSHISARTESMGYTPLHCAVFGAVKKNPEGPEGYLQVARALLNHDAPIMIADENGDTPLHCACKLNNLKMVQVLFENGDHIRKGNLPKINSVNRSGQSSMHIACAAGHLEIVKFLHPIEGTERRETQKFYHHYADLSSRNEFSSTPLHEAIGNEHVEIVKYLVCLKDQRFDQKNNDKYKPEELARSLETEKGNQMEAIVKQAREQR
jgi:ankyrin repeat protein